MKQRLLGGDGMSVFPTSGTFSMNITPHGHAMGSFFGAVPWADVSVLYFEGGVSIMKTRARSTALYPHPFSKAYWRDAARELGDTHMLVFAALMIAVRVAMKPLAIPLGGTLKLNTASLANALGAMVFGPVVAAVAAVVSDVLGVLITGETYFPPFVLTEIASSMIFALCLYRAKLTARRVIIARFSISFFVNILLQTPLKMLYYKLVLQTSSYVMTIPVIIKNLVLFPLEAVVLTLFLSVMQPVTYRMMLTFDPSPRLKFGKRQIALLLTLFAIGVGCVLGYLNYYYSTTSRSASYTASERYAHNTDMIAVVQEHAPEYAGDTLVTTVESAYRSFLGKDTTYTVKVYVVNTDLLSGYEKSLDDLRGMSKSTAKAAAEDGVMTAVGTATVVLREDTGEVLSFVLQ